MVTRSQKARMVTALGVEETNQQSSEVAVEGGRREVNASPEVGPAGLRLGEERVEVNTEEEDEEEERFGMPPWKATHLSENNRVEPVPL